MKYLLNTFMDEAQCTKYTNSVSIMYYVNDKLLIGDTYSNKIPMKLLKRHIETAKRLLGEHIESIIKVNH